MCGGGSLRRMWRRMRVVQFTVLGLGRCRGCWLVDRLWFDDLVVVLASVQWSGAWYRQGRRSFGDRVEATAALLLVVLFQLVSQRL